MVPVGLQALLVHIYRTASLPVKSQTVPTKYKKVDRGAKRRRETSLITAAEEDRCRSPVHVPLLREARSTPARRRPSPTATHPALKT